MLVGFVGTFSTFSTYNFRSHTADSRLPMEVNPCEPGS
jgi:hypothetical protein